MNEKQEEVFRALLDQSNKQKRDMEYMQKEIDAMAKRIDELEEDAL